MNLLPSLAKSLSVLSLPVLLILPTLVAAEGRALEGQKVARQWCVSCHVVESGQVASDGAPAFSQIASDPMMTPERLRGWLVDPHPPMPDLNLTTQEISDIVDYLESLKP